MSKIPIFGDAVVSFFSIQPMHRNDSPLLLFLLLLLFCSPNGSQPTPPLDKMDPDSLVEETNTNRLAGHHLHHPIHPRCHQTPCY